MLYNITITRTLPLLFPLPAKARRGNGYCFEKKVIIELDGPIHEETEEFDQFRDSELKRLGFKILRIKNEVLENIEEVRRKILSFITGIN